MILYAVLGQEMVNTRRQMMATNAIYDLELCLVRPGRKLWFHVAIALVFHKALLRDIYSLQLRAVTCHAPLLQQRMHL